MATAALVVSAAVLAGAAIADGRSTSPAPEEALVFTGVNAGSRDLFRQRLGGAPVPLTEDRFGEGEPALSPDGSRIAFVSDRGGSLDIWVMDVDGTEARRLTDHAAMDVSPSWDPEGRRIAFVSEREGDRSNVYVLDVASGALRQVTFQDKGIIFPSWSPDGEWIAYSVAGVIPAGSEVIPLRLELIPAVGGEAVVLLEGSGWYWGAAWSPDSQSIAYAWSPWGFTPISAAWLEIIDVNGENPRRLRRGGWADHSPSWAPDGLRIAFTSTERGFAQIYIWDLVTNEIHLVLGGVPASDPEWVRG